MSTTTPSQKFLNAIPYSLANEGGYTTYYSDPGNWTGGIVGNGTLAGTKYGISAAQFPNLNIKNLTVDEAKSIYYEKYWIPCNAEALPAGIDFLVFDAAINSGIGVAVRLLQSVVGVLQDGDFGPITTTAFNNYILSNSAASFIAAYQEAHIKFLMRLSTWNLFSNDFINRNMLNIIVAVSLNLSLNLIAAPAVPE
jgi:lysozyme family protein